MRAAACCSSFSKASLTFWNSWRLRILASEFHVVLTSLSYKCKTTNPTSKSPPKHVYRMLNVAAFQFMCRCLPASACSMRLDSSCSLRTSCQHHAAQFNALIILTMGASSTQAMLSHAGRRQTPTKPSNASQPSSLVLQLSLLLCNLLQLLIHFLNAETLHDITNSLSG